jgi:hypothetical protein
MPQRFLRPGIRSSIGWNSVSWFTQSFYTRLLTLVDDFGRYEAEPLVLRGMAFPLGDHEGKPVDMKAILEACEQLRVSGLAIFYEVKGKKFLQVTKWQERARSKKSLFPDPDNNCEQMTTSADKCCLSSPYALRLTPSSSPEPKAKEKECVDVAPAAGAASLKTSLARALTVKEVEDFCESEGLPRSDGETFWHSHEANGWTTNNKPIKNWQAKIRSWKKQGFMPSQKPTMQPNGYQKPAGGLVRELQREMDRDAALAKIELEAMQAQFPHLAGNPDGTPLFKNTSKRSVL